MLIGSNVVGRRIPLTALATATMVGVTVQGLGKFLTPFWLVLGFMVVDVPRRRYRARAQERRVANAHPHAHRPRAARPCVRRVERRPERGGARRARRRRRDRRRARRAGDALARGRAVGARRARRARGARRPPRQGPGDRAERGYDRLPVSPDAVHHVSRETPSTCFPDGRARRRSSQLGRPLRVKLGIDVTAPDIHLGIAHPARSGMRAFQDAGHVGVLIVGRLHDADRRSLGSLGRATRCSIRTRSIERRRRSSSRRSRVLDPRADGDPLQRRMARGARLRGRRSGLTRTMTVAQLLERDDFSKRFAAHEPISVSELLYPLMQAYDSVAVEADVEIGGHRPALQPPRRAERS